MNGEPTPIRIHGTYEAHYTTLYYTSNVQNPDVPQKDLAIHIQNTEPLKPGQGPSYATGLIYWPHFHTYYAIKLETLNCTDKLNGTAAIYVAMHKDESLDTGRQLFRAQADDLLARIVNVWDAQRLAFLGAFHHGARIFRRDDDQISAANFFFQREFVGAGHCAGVKGSDLVIVQIGVDKERGGKEVGNLDHGRGVHSLRFQPGAVLAKILPGGPYHHRPFAQQRQRVGDVGSYPPVPFLHPVHQKAHAQPVDLVRQDVLGKAAGKGEEIIERN